jgi:hypothetical protein
MAMRMNQQRQNGFIARPKYNENNGQQRHHYQQQQSVPKQEFKPVAILKRGDPSGTTIINKDDSQSKENISANGQQTKSTSYRVYLKEKSLVFYRDKFFYLILSASCHTTTTTAFSTYNIIIIISSKSSSNFFITNTKSFNINPDTFSIFIHSTTTTTTATTTNYYFE